MRSDRGGTIETTMLELVAALSADMDDDRQVVAAVYSLLESGRVRLIGTFRDSGVPRGDAGRGSRIGKAAGTEGLSRPVHLGRPRAKRSH